MADFNQSLLQLSGGRELLTIAKTEQLISEWTNLEPVAIRLSNKSFDQESALKVAEYLDKINATLQIADISDVIAGRPEEEALKAIKVLATGLKRFELVEINVSDNAFGAKGIEVCREILIGKRMEKLYVCNNGLSAEACLLLSEILLDVCCPPLKVFHFYNNMSGDGGGKALSTLIQACVSLEDLRFSATRCGNAGCMEIAKAIGTINKLRKIDLSDNTFGISAGKVLATSLLTQANTLETLNLRDDGLTSDGIEAVFTILSSKEFPKLTTLDISGNEMTEESMKVLCDVFFNQNTIPTLSHLYLDDNEFGSNGIIFLAKAVKKLTSLTHLSLNTCEVTGKGALAIVKALVKLPTFQQLDINGNQLTTNAIEEMIKIFDQAKKTLGELDDNDEDGDDDMDELEEEEEEEVEEEEEGEEDKDEEVDDLAAAIQSTTI